MASVRIWAKSLRNTCSTRDMHEDATKRACSNPCSGLQVSIKEILANALREAASNSTHAISTGDEGFGATFEIRFRLTADKGTATVLSAWIIRNGEDFPRLTTCFII